jgi:hypothetical protein
MLDIASQTGLSQGRRTRQRLLLGGGSAILIAFVVTFLVEGATRPGYSPWRHAVSQLSLGPPAQVQPGRHVSSESPGSASS